SAATVQVLREVGVPFKAIDVLAEPEKREAIKRFSNWPTIPQVYVGGKFIGGCDIVREMHGRGELAPLLRAAVGGGDAGERRGGRGGGGRVARGPGAGGGEGGGGGGRRRRGGARAQPEAQR